MISSFEPPGRSCIMDCSFLFNTAASFAVLLMFVVARWPGAGRQISDDSRDATDPVLNTSSLSSCRLSSSECSMLTSSLNLRRGRISFHNTAVDAAARDWGSIKRLAPAGVLYPESVDDIVSLVRTTTRLSSSSSNLTLAAKGRGHSVNGQAQVLHLSTCWARVKLHYPRAAYICRALDVPLVCRPALTWRKCARTRIAFCLISVGRWSRFCRLWTESWSRCRHWRSGSRWCRKETQIAQWRSWMRREASFGLTYSRRHSSMVWLPGAGPTISIWAWAGLCRTPASADKPFDMVLKSATCCNWKLLQVRV